MPSSINEKRRAVRGLGEIALRVKNLDAMQRFYENVIGLPLMTRFPNAAFFKIADGYGGHTQVLALFDRSKNPGIASRTQGLPPLITSLSKFLSPISRQKREKKRLEGLGLRVETAEHGWAHWRSLYATDPEGNQVELVCYDDNA